MRKIIQSRIVLGILIAAVAVFVLYLCLPLVFADSGRDDKNDKERFVVKTTDLSELKEFEGKGCKPVHRFKFSSALDCPLAIGVALDLQQDIKVFAVDSAANTKIGADLVHAQGLTGMGRRIAVLDTGIDSDHPELADSYDITSRCFISGCSTPEDDNGHGTFVSGLITANGLVTNAKGTAPDATVWAGKVLDASGSGYISDIIAAINYITANVTADAISMSLGTSPPYTYTGSGCDGVVPDLDDAIHNAIAAGISVVAAAGNSGRSGVSIPGCISGVITVGAVDINDIRASFSSIGNSLDVMALGVNDYSTLMGGSYGRGSGTSFSTPIVSGVIALMEQKNSGITPGDITNILRSTALDLGVVGFDNKYGYGRVNALKAVSSTPSSGPYLSLSANPSTITTAQTSTITVSTSDKVQSVVVNFMSNIGTVGASCTTDSTGTCSFTFTSTTAGTATITGTATGYASGSTSVKVTQAPVLYSATFSQSGIPTGVKWGVTVGGKRYTSTISSVSVSELSGTVSYKYDSSITVGKTRYTCTTGCSGSVTSTNNIKTATYKIQSRSSGRNN